MNNQSCTCDGCGTLLQTDSKREWNPTQPYVNVETRSYLHGRETGGGDFDFCSEACAEKVLTAHVQVVVAAVGERLRRLRDPQPTASTEEPSCTGTLVHDEFIRCPVHDR